MVAMKRPLSSSPGLLQPGPIDPAGGLVEAAFPFVHPLDLVLYDEGGGAIDPLELLHREGVYIDLTIVNTTFANLHPHGSLFFNRSNLLTLAG